MMDPGKHLRLFQTIRSLSLGRLFNSSSMLPDVSTGRIVWRSTCPRAFPGTQPFLRLPLEGLNTAAQKNSRPWPIGETRYQYCSGIGQKPDPRQKDMGMVFTCSKCDTRAVKVFSRHSYEKGLVIVRCPGCQSLHLVADNLGWFEDNFNVEKLLLQRGEKVTRTTSGEARSLEAGDLIGWSRVQKVLAAMSEAGRANTPQVAAGTAAAVTSTDAGSSTVAVASPDAHAVAREADNESAADGRQQQQQQQQLREAGQDLRTQELLDHVGEVLELSPQDVKEWEAARKGQ